MGNTELPYSNHVRYLGVELDSKLTWKRHVHEKVMQVVGTLTEKNSVGLLLNYTAGAHIWLSCVGKGNNGQGYSVLSCDNEQACSNANGKLQD